jgi:hypothetical protein
MSGLVLNELESVFNILSKEFPDYENRFNPCENEGILDGQNALYHRPFKYPIR